MNGFNTTIPGIGIDSYTGDNPGAIQLAIKNPNAVGIGNSANAYLKNYETGSGLSNYGLGNIGDSNSSINWLGRNGILDSATTGIQALSAGMNAWNGFQNMNLAKHQFAFEKAAANRNVANQGLAYNTELDRRRSVGLALAGNTLSAAAKKAYNAKTQSMQANTSAIG